MIKSSVKEFRSFLERKLDETVNCSLPQSERAARVESLSEILGVHEVLDPIYDKHDTVWLLAQVKGMRSDAQYYLDINSSRIDNLKDSLKMSRDRLDALNKTLEVYQGMNLSEHDFVEVEVNEAKDEVTLEIQETEKRELTYVKELEEAEYNEKLVYILHRLEGILMNPGYFNYLKRRA